MNVLCPQIQCFPLQTIEHVSCPSAIHGFQSGQLMWPITEVSRLLAVIAIDANLTLHSAADVGSTVIPKRQSGTVANVSNLLSLTQREVLSTHTYLYTNVLLCSSTSRHAELSSDHSTSMVPVLVLTLCNSCQWPFLAKT